MSNLDELLSLAPEFYTNVLHAQYVEQRPWSMNSLQKQSPTLFLSLSMNPLCYFYTITCLYVVNVKLVLEYHLK